MKFGDDGGVQSCDSFYIEGSEIFTRGNLLQKADYLGSRNLSGWMKKGYLANSKPFSFGVPAKIISIR
jgi:hypothetical protein